MSTLLKPYGIIVGVDGSAASNVAVCWAAREAAMRGIQLTLVHMVKTAGQIFPEVTLAAEIVAWHEDEGRRVVAEAAKIAEDATNSVGELKIASTLRYSPPVLALDEMSDEAEMIVVGSNGRGALGRLFLGSVSSGVVRRAKCPVAIIRDEDPLMPYPLQAPVLVGIDGSPASERATAIAFDEASRRGVELKALQAWSDTEVLAFSGVDWVALQAETERSLAERLAGRQEQYPDVKVHRLVVRDRPARELIAHSESAQLVVVGSHGRGGLTGALLGSVSNAVVHAVRMPVIVARP